MSTDEDLMDVGVKRSEKVWRIQKQTFGSLHEKKNFSCGKCDKSFNQKPALKQHEIAVHEGKKKNKCKICGKKWSQPSNLKAHESSVHKKIKFQKCEICLTTLLTSIQV